MSEAHEKTRIRQLEDAAAHWEHKYVNARQYNRNLEERCQKLEAALVKIASDGRVHVPNKSSVFAKADYRAGYVCGFEHQADIARTALGSEMETPEENPRLRPIGFCPECLMAGGAHKLRCSKAPTPAETGKES